jgi:hypothetical protein
MDNSGKELTHRTREVININTTDDGEIPYAITAGHVLLGGEKFDIVQRITEERIEAVKVPLCSPGKNAEIKREVGIFELDPKDSNEFSAYIP